MAESERDRNRAIVEAVREVLAPAAMRLPAAVEPATIYSLSPEPEKVERGPERS